MPGVHAGLSGCSGSFNQFILITLGTGTGSLPYLGPITSSNPYSLESSSWLKTPPGLQLSKHCYSRTIYYIGLFISLFSWLSLIYLQVNESEQFMHYRLKFLKYWIFENLRNLELCERRISENRGPSVYLSVLKLYT